VPPFRRVNLTSVIIPVFNGQAYLGEALKSVLAQDIELDILVVDDGSTDKTGDVARAFGGASLRYVRQGQLGLAAARNHGVSLARGNLIAFLDADDVWLANKLRRQIASLERNEGDMIFTYVEEFISPDCAQDIGGSIDVRPRLPGLSASTFLIRRSDFKKVGNFNVDCRMGEFIEWYARAVDVGLRPAILPDIFARRRLHRNNMTRTDLGQRKQYAQAVKKILDRRRALL
jgi:glycosyltransferase involved in cell wall biosynthesis